MAKIADNTVRNQLRESPTPTSRNGRAMVRDSLRGFIDAPIDTHLERIGNIMDRAIKVPGTNISVGLDPIIGFFFPVLGDWVGGIVSTYIVLASIRHGLPKSTIAKMVFNVGVDVLLGTIPFVGDAFDFAWKPNEKNLRLLNKYATGKRGTFWGDWAWVVALLGLLGLFMVAMIAIAIYSLNKAGFHLL
ncbi:MAG: DUF4112 domain-containing protein [Blastocatellia bacterium]